MNLAPYLSVLLALAVGAIIAAVTLWFSRRSGLQPVQSELIDNLKDNTAALDRQVSMLREQLAVEIENRKLLERKVTGLQSAIADLAQENTQLRKQLGMPPREEST